MSEKSEELKKKKKLEAQERMARNKAQPRTVTMRGQGKPKPKE